MSVTVRLATFNVENLFARYRFRSKVDPKKAVTDGWKADQRRFKIHDPTSKSLTGKVIRELQADILALQEVEGLDTLRRFRSRYLGGIRRYPHALLIDGNDPRLIDVAVLSKHPIVHARSYHHLRDGRTYLFSRDCLEVDVRIGESRKLTLFVNHLKSMMEGRAATRARRQLQARQVRKIVAQRFGANAGEHPFAIVGDLNDYPETDSQGRSGIAELLDWDQVDNVVERLPVNERWTHYYKTEKAYRQLDYVLLSTVLANSNARVNPIIERRGLPRRATGAGQQRFAGVGEHRPKASDHCAVAMDITLQ